MSEFWKQIAAVFAIILFLPLLLALLIQGKAYISFTEKEELEIYLPFLMAETLEEDSHMETMKAWAVLMRSNVTKALDEGSVSLSDLRSQYVNDAADMGEEYEQFYEKLVSACRATEGEMVFFEGEVCYCPYFQVSNGVTRDPFENFSENVYPYLMSVSSQQDEESYGYMKVTYYEMSEFYKMIDDLYLSGENTQENDQIQSVPVNETEANAAVKQETADSGSTVQISSGTEDASVVRIEIAELDSAGYVKWIKIGDRTIGGETFRKDMGLNSSCFSIETTENQVRITCRGKGHGFGLSWYGADTMAREGKNYKELIEYYFYNVTISKGE